jgi:hypothetical protein
MNKFDEQVHKRIEGAAAAAPLNGIFACHTFFQRSFGKSVDLSRFLRLWKHKFAAVIWKHKHTKAANL